MKTIFDKFDKGVIASLPQAAFAGRIEVVSGESKAKSAVDYLLSQPILGLDTETKPSFHRGDGHKVALLQVSSHDICFLFRLNHIDMPDCIVRLLSDTEVLKVGLSWNDDLCMLRRRRDFTPGRFEDIQQIVGTYGIKDMSLQKLYANIFGQRISKTQRLSNWEADVLTDKQKLYAATDAWACIMLHEELERMRQDGYRLVCTHTDALVEDMLSKKQ